MARGQGVTASSVLTGRRACRIVAGFSGFPGACHVSWGRGQLLVTWFSLSSESPNWKHTLSSGSSGVEPPRKGDAAAKPRGELALEMRLWPPPQQHSSVSATARPASCPVPGSFFTCLTHLPASIFKSPTRQELQATEPTPPSTRGPGVRACQAGPAVAQQVFPCNTNSLPFRKTVAGVMEASKIKNQHLAAAVQR